jgi:putative endonuclease
VGRKFESYLGSKIGDDLVCLLFFAAMFYIYILLSECSGYYYIGHSDDPERRLFEHNNIDKDTYTSKHRPWGIVFKYPVSETRSDALIIEKYLKKRKSKVLLDKLVLKQKDTVFLNTFLNKILAKRRMKNGKG